MITDIQGVPIVISRGNSYELGRQHGQAARARIQNTIDVMLYLCQQNVGLDNAQARELAMKFLPNVEKYDSRYVEELRGIADGSGLDFEDIMVINARTELLKLPKKPLGGGVDMRQTGCTSVAVTGEVTSDSSTYVGQTWDFLKISMDSLIAHLIIPDDGRPSVFYVGEAGLISRMGINSVGIGGGVNSLSTSGPVNLSGIPLQFVLRGVMESRNLAEAIEAVQRMPNGAVNNIMIGYRDSEAVDVEIDHDNCECLYPQDSIITHTNHYVHPNRPHYPYHCIYTGSSIVRKGRSEKLLRGIKNKKGCITPEDIMEVFTDHGNYPYSICVHGDETEPYSHQTDCAFICNLSTLEMDISIGNPCKNGFLRVRPFEDLV
ncbi:MAG: C45 family autoproteolytic acyltransferase/hydrolase [Oscillospiraceae bacterium]